MSVEAMKQALEALETLAQYENPETRIQVRKPKEGGPIVTMYPHKVASEAAAALRAAIEQAQEPVAWGVFDGPNLHDVNFTEEEAQEMMRLKGDGSVVKPLYTSTQPQMQPCAGRNCGSTDPSLHSAECFEDYEKSTGMVQEPMAWVYPEGLEALKSGRPWTAYGSSGGGRIPLYLDAVARRVEPPAAESGAGFESLPASPKWQGLTDEEIRQVCWESGEDGTTGDREDAVRAAIARLKEKNT